MRGRRPGGLAALLVCLALTVAAPPGASGANLPNGFQDTVAIGGLSEPTAVRFAADGRVFVAEKSGRILVYDGLEDPIPSEFANLSAQVYDNGDRGILGLALDPGYPVRPYVYVLYTFDHVLGEDAPGVFPRWGNPATGYVGDPCPKPESADVDACPVSGRLVRLTDVGDRAEESGGAVAEDVLIEGWCQQGSSHSVGDLEFGPEGALFASGGEGASFLSADYGQFGWPHKNQCGDPPGGFGVALEPPDAEGGSLRAQDVLTPGDPTGLSGTVIRVDPETGAGLPGNPFAASADANARRIIGFGFRNPFRFAINDETHEVYVDNVGGGPIEEIDRLSTEPTTAYNSGWPCYEGTEPTGVFESVGLALCEDLYDSPGSTSLPLFSYNHHVGVTPGESGCPRENGSAISGSAFYEGEDYPDAYHGALFFADSVFGCIYVMYPGPDGRPDPSTVEPFLTEGGIYPGVDIQPGPGGDLFYVKMFSDGFGPGEIHRISYFSGNHPPLAELSATPRWAAGPLTAQLDAGGSSDADGEALSYEWDLDGDGGYEAASAVAAREVTFSDSQNHTVAVRVNDEQGARRVARVTLFPNDTPPEPVIVDPVETSPGSGVAALTWGVGQRIDFDGLAHDLEDGDLPATELDWSARIYHCPGSGSSCHAHGLPAFPGVAGASFGAPDHDYPSRIELMLTATDSRQLSASRTIALYPRHLDIQIGSDPAGIALTAGFNNAPAPFSMTVIEGSHLTLSAPEKVSIGGRTYLWRGWSDGGPRVHTVIAGGPVTSYQASYAEQLQPSAATPSSSGGRSQPKPNPKRPRTSLLKRPAAVTGLRGARFLFISNDPGGGFRCRLDRGAYRPCKPPRVYPRLALGPHVFRVYAVSAAGAADASPVVVRWTIVPSRPPAGGD